MRWAAKNEFQYQRALDATHHWLQQTKTNKDHDNTKEHWMSWGRAEPDVRLFCRLKLKVDLSNKHQNLFDKYVCAVKVDALQVWGPQLGVPQSQCVRRVTPTLVLKYANKDPKLCLSAHKFPGFMMAFQWDGPVEPSWWWNQVLSGVPYWVTITDSWFWFDSNLG